METRIFEKDDFLKDMIDAIPSLMFIVDEDVRIFFANAAASAMIEAGRDSIHMKRGGEVLRCIHSIEAPEGCGYAESCKACDVRNTVNEAFRGAKISRKNTAMELKKDDGKKEVNLSISAAPFNYGGKKLVLLILEDISELVHLRNILPICIECKKIRSDEGYWQNVEKYFHEHLGVDFSHSICPECVNRHYPQHYSRIME